MYAIIPDQSKERVGVGKWLSVHQRFPGVRFEFTFYTIFFLFFSYFQAVEVKCEPYKFHINSVVGNLAARLLRRETRERKGALFKQFFSIIAQIEMLVLDHMNDPYFKVRTRKTIFYFN